MTKKKHICASKMKIYLCCTKCGCNTYVHDTKCQKICPKCGSPSELVLN